MIHMTMTESAHALVCRLVDAAVEVIAANADLLSDLDRAIGDRKANVLRKLGAPASQSAASMRYCVEGGGELRLAFDTSGRLRFVASTSFSTRIRKIRTGSSLLRVKHVYPHAFWIGKRLLRAAHGSRVVFGSCSCGSVAFVAMSPYNVRSSRLQSRPLDGDGPHRSNTLSMSA